MKNDPTPNEDNVIDLTLVEPDWRQLFEQAQLGLSVICARTNRFIVVNQNFARQHGWSPEELRGQPVTSVCAPEQHELLAAQLREIDRNGQGAFEIIDVRQDGSHFPVRMKISTLFDEQGQATMRMAYSSDISQRKILESRLEMLAQVVEQSPQAIIITNLDSSIEYVNEAFVQDTGYSREEALHRNASLISSGRTPPEQYIEMWDALCTGQACKGEFHNRRKNGTEYAVSAVLSPLRDANGEITHYASINDDITERKRIANELERHRAHLEEMITQRTLELRLAKLAAERANEAKSHFLTTMSHEMRTPMNGVVGSTEVLIQSRLSPEQHELARTIRDSALGLLRIINDILDLSKIEAGHMEIDAAPLQIEQLAESVCDALGPMAHDHNVALDLYIAPTLPFEIVSDAMRLRQILNNLLGNAIKFSSKSLPHGCVSLRVENIGQETLRLQVSDNGIGISPENQARLFQPFAQAETSTTRRFGGTGLGLSICRQLITLMGGHLTLESAEGRGTTVFVLLPLRVIRHAGNLPQASPDLQGIECLLWTRRAQRQYDWSDYLRHAGASVRWHTAGTGAPTTETKKPAPVLVVDESIAVTETRAWIEAGLPLVRIGHGKGHHPHLDAGGWVLLDSQAMHRLALLSAIELALGREPPAEDADMPPEMLFEIPSGPRPLILVAEDNSVNRMVIRQQLDLLGYACELAENGKEALQLWREKPEAYALLLTDLHMPEMDGNELAITIRREEMPPSQLPIIMLSANAFDKKAAYWHDIGVNDYLCKPMPLDQLKEKLQHWIISPTADSAPEDATDTTDATTAAEPALLDVRVLAKLVGNDPDLINEVLHDYAVTLQEATDEIRRHAADANWRAVASVAHKLKSSSASVGARALGQCCQVLEQTGLGGDTATARDALTAFDALLPRTLKALAQRDNPQ